MSGTLYLIIEKINGFAGYCSMVIRYFLGGSKKERTFEGVLPVSFREMTRVGRVAAWFAGVRSEARLCPF